MGMIGSVKRHFDPSKGGVSVSDRAMAALAAMNGDAATAYKIKHAGAAERKHQEEMAPILNLFKGVPASAGPIGPGVDGNPIGGTTATPAGVPSMDRALPTLAPAILGGVPGADDVARLIQGAQPKPPAHIEGPDGIYVMGPNGPQKIVSYPPKQDIPFGWEIGPDNNPRPKKGGPADPAYIAQTAGVLRDAIVSRPIPHGGGGGGSAKRAPHQMTDAELLAIATGGK